MVSLNNLTDQSQFITTGTSGTNFNIVSSGDTHTFNLPVASATNTGKLSSTDWSTFNGKQPAGNYVTLDTTQTITAAKTFTGTVSSIADVNAAAYILQGRTSDDLAQIQFKNNAATNTKAKISVYSVGTNGGAMQFLVKPDGLPEVSSLSLSSNQADFETSVTSTGIFRGTTLGILNSTFTTTIGASLTANRTITIPDASGTLALTSNLSSYVPYTGANANVDLGAFSLTASSVGAAGFFALGSGTVSGYIALKQGTTLLGNVTGYNSINSNATRFIFISDIGSSNFKSASFQLGSLTNNTERTFTLPDLSGTLALLEGTQTFTGDKLFNGTVDFNNSVDINSGLFIRNNVIGSTLYTSFTITKASSTQTLSYLFSTAFASNLLFNDAANYSYTFPTASGTIALTSNLSSYVPYTGATANVNLGIYQIISSGADFRAQGVNTPIGLVLSSEYNVIANPKTIYTGYGESTTLGGHEFRSVNGSGTGSITSLYLAPSGAATFYYSVTANSFIKSGGTSSQFLKADGNIDSTSYYPTSGGIISGNIYMQSSANPSQLLAKGVNTEFWVDSQYGGGTARAFINRNGVGNQATLMFSTGVAITNGTAWAGVCDYSMGMTNDGTSNFYIGAGDLFSSSNRALTITPSKNIGIGTSDPQSVLNGFSGSARGLVIENAYPVLAFSDTSSSLFKFYVGTDSGEAYIWNVANGPTRFGTNNTERMRITSSGLVELNAADATYIRFSYLGTSKAFVGVAGASSDVISGAAAGDTVIRAQQKMLFSTNGDTERMRITSDGNVVIGTASTVRRLNVGSTTTPGFFHNTTNASSSYCNIWQLGGSSTNDTSSYYLYCDTDAIGVRMVIYGNGNLANVNNSYGAYSDIKLKENITDATPKLDDLLKVKIRNYNLKGDDRKQIGVIAQELEEIFPALIEESDDTIKDEKGEYIKTGEKTKTVKYSVFVPMLIKAIQEQQAQIEELKELIKNK
jgi:hypothetical protein